MLNVHADKLHPAVRMLYSAHWLRGSGASLMLMDRIDVIDVTFGWISMQCELPCTRKHCCMLQNTAVFFNTLLSSWRKKNA